MISWLLVALWWHLHTSDLWCMIIKLLGNRKGGAVCLNCMYTFSAFKLTCFLSHAYGYFFYFCMSVISRVCVCWVQLDLQASCNWTCFAVDWRLQHFGRGNTSNPQWWIGFFPIQLRTPVDHECEWLLALFIWWGK